MKKYSIIIFSILILLIFSFIFLLSFPWIFGYQHQAIAFLGIFLIIFTIPIMVFIFLKKSINIFSLVYYVIYFLLTSTINLISSGFIQDVIFYKFPFRFTISQFLRLGTFWFFFIFFSLQCPIIVLCLIIRKIKKSNEPLNVKFFLKEPWIYIFLCSLSLFPLILLHG